MARSIMFQGTASHVGKSVLTAALCRILHQDGWRVAPFKAQNMSLNSGVTPDGGEIGRAQMLQAQAAGLPPSVDMNPILLKPRGDMTSQVIVHGRPLGDADWRRYRGEYRELTLRAVRDSLARLQAGYEVLVLEGAGSPAEVNLRAGDIANMTAAELADARVLLVGDIDRGGVIASLVGTLALLAPQERARVAGLVINLFRGDPTLFADGVRFLEESTGLPVLGVIPYLPDLGLDEEDAVARGNRDRLPGAVLDVAVIRLPRISNFTDFDPLAAEPGVSVRYIDRPEALGIPDALILPGTKNSLEDLVWLYERGLAAAVARLAGAGVPVLGVCGGYQMLGLDLVDAGAVESHRPRLPGLGLLPVRTEFHPEKLTVQAEAEPGPGAPDWLAAVGRVRGYEIHMGRTHLLTGAVPLWRLTRRGGSPCADPDGVAAEDGRVLGTYLHGLFENTGFRRAWLNQLRRRRGLPPLPLQGEAGGDPRELALDRLAEHVRRHLDVVRVYEILGLSGPRQSRP